MDEQFAVLIAGALSFVGLHFVLSHPFRRPLVRRWGEKKFLAIYSAVAGTTFLWMVLAFAALPRGGTSYWNGQSDPAWVIASLLLLPASVLLVGSFSGNPAAPDPDAKKLARKNPRGVFRTTRHPMMWSMTLWSLAHLIVSPTPRVLVLGLAITSLALLGAYLQDNKKLITMGGSWEVWERRTTFFPRFSRLIDAGPVPWTGGVLLWLGASWLHGPILGAPAGIWRWL